MPALDFDDVVKALRGGGHLSTEQVDRIDMLGEETIRWDVTEFVREFEITPLEALGMRQLVHDAYDGVGVTGGHIAEVPKLPSYLDDVGEPATSMKPDAAGTVLDKEPATTGDYDPGDPTQWEKIGDEYYRWDGYRSEEFPGGRSHRITFIDHRRGPGDVLIPDPNQVQAALDASQGWFHKSYECWILPNGKRAVEVGQERLMAVRNAGGRQARALA